VIVGRRMINDSIKSEYLYIYKREDQYFMLKFMIKIGKMKIFDEVSMKFYFENETKQINSVIFCKKDMIFSLNFIT
jgi:hypothetical protein